MSREQAPDISAKGVANLNSLSRAAALPPAHDLAAADRSRVRDAELTAVAVQPRQAALGDPNAACACAPRRTAAGPHEASRRHSMGGEWGQEAAFCSGRAGFGGVGVRALSRLPRAPLACSCPVSLHRKAERSSGRQPRPSQLCNRACVRRSGWQEHPVGANGFLARRSSRFAFRPLQRLSGAAAPSSAEWLPVSTAQRIAGVFQLVHFSTTATYATTCQQENYADGSAGKARTIHCNNGGASRACRISTNELQRRPRRD